MQSILHFNYLLPFHYPFQISGNRIKTHQPTFIIHFKKDGITGYGEAPAINYYNITVEKMANDLLNNISELNSANFSHPEEYYELLVRLFPQNSFLRCAIDMAVWDWFGKLSKLPLYQLWNTKWENIPITDYTIGIDNLKIMKQKINQNPLPIYKIKVGFEEDIQLIKHLQSESKSKFRIDVNEGWGLNEAKEKIKILNTSTLELIEQPIEKGNWKGMQEIIQQSHIPIIADESCVNERDIDLCAPCFHGVNIKLTKCGGITPALRMIKAAENYGLSIMMGSMNESSIGTAAVANFLPQLDYVDMDGPLLLKEDLAKGLIFKKGEVSITNKPGLGIELVNLIETN
jgi:L-alanine-DL-glutamate epimerase-like enolase superfamily enzyme